MIRLYGHMQGSFATVSNGLYEAFSEDVLSGFHVGESQDFFSDPVGGADAPVAVVVGDPMRVMLAHTQGQHQEVWLLLAPNSEGIPPATKAQLLEKAPGGKQLVTGFLAPSTWAQRVLAREFPYHPVVLCRHGLLQEFRRPFGKYAGTKMPCALHITSSGLSRKCTKELISVWKQVQTQELNKLVILSNPMFKMQIEGWVQEQGLSDNILVLNGQNESTARLVEVYHQVSLVIQPSRAEGFGLVPLEARACGTPVVMTNGTGHDDHGRVPTPKGCVRISPSDMGESDDYWGAQALVVPPDRIAEQVSEALQRLDTLSKEAEEVAPQIQEHWTWRAGAQEFVNRTQEKYG